MSASIFAELYSTDPTEACIPIFKVVAALTEAAALKVSIAIVILLMVFIFFPLFFPVTPCLTIFKKNFYFV
ncbi:Uncharacterised protein [Vibrio cholerae]|uniref:Uncharacterized protein n=1 Tax=Vibrio cholerae TaxID=666 RepID=A0A655R4R5_VIBCL|nr:Uncharacterised protein [Vibrio cholerae]